MSAKLRVDPQCYALAVKLARHKMGDTLWDNLMTENERELEINKQMFFISNANGAGYVLTEVGDGR